jgi:hypothetical protein
VPEYLLDATYKSPAESKVIGLSSEPTDKKLNPRNVVVVVGVKVEEVVVLGKLH